MTPQDAEFLKLLHIQFYWSSWKHNPDRVRGKWNAKAVYLVAGYFSLLCLWLLSRLIQSDTQPLREPYLLSGGSCSRGWIPKGCCPTECSEVVRLRFREETVKGLSVPPVPGRQPLCLTLAGAPLGLEACFNWGRGQRSEDALPSPLRLPLPTERRWRFPSHPVRGSGKTIPGKAARRQLPAAAAGAAGAAWARGRRRRHAWGECAAPRTSGPAPSPAKGRERRAAAARLPAGAREGGREAESLGSPVGNAARRGNAVEELRRLPCPAGSVSGPMSRRRGAGRHHPGAASPRWSPHQCPAWAPQQLFGHTGRRLRSGSSFLPLCGDPGRGCPRFVPGFCSPTAAAHGPRVPSAPRAPTALRVGQAAWELCALWPYGHLENTPSKWRICQESVGKWPYKWLKKKKKKDSCSFASYGKVSSGRGKRWQLAMLFPASHAACTIAMRPLCSNEVCILSFHRKTSLNKEDTNTATKAVGLSGEGCGLSP